MATAPTISVWTRYAGNLCLEFVVDALSTRAAEKRLVDFQKDQLHHFGHDQGFTSNSDR